MKKIAGQAFNLKNIGFGGYLDDSEDVVHVFRPMGNFVFAKSLLLAIATGAAAYALYMWNPAWWYVWGAPIVLGGVKVFQMFLQWYFHAIVLTTANVLFTYWKGPFHKHSSRVDYWDLDEIEVERKGVRAFLYNFGSLTFVKTSGGKQTTFDMIRRPHKKAKIIESFREEMVHHKNFHQDSALRDLMSELLARHVDTNGVSGDVPTLKTKQAPQMAPAQPKQSQPKRDRHVAPGMDIDIEKKLDDTGGIDIPLDE